MLSVSDTLEEALEVAKLLVKLAPHVRELAEDLAALRRRQGRDAEAGDLEDSISKLKSLERKRG